MLLALDSVSLYYDDKPVIDQLSLSINQGEKLAIVGASGAGKSTLLTHIFHQLESDAALCSQSQGLVENLSIFHNIYMGALCRHGWPYNLANLVWPFKRHLAEVKTLCDLLELPVALNTRVSALSGGQRQRVAIARAIYQQKNTFLGDEAFSALDPVMASRLLEYVLAQHTSVVMVLHDCRLALGHFDRVVGLKQGKVALNQLACELNEQMLSEFFDNQFVEAVS
ncbi:ATP-binding cassette domain-containing protein [Shewanella sp. Isolate11]|uniref:ATP-binding cassette domain-containing protein n=1 Tax=Shewanella sp. Isolate11 TaxID=2908530 RepID=UPI001EFC655E|nr:ATP-binding cassette domain-containing protein [Shewanella sp. Isolate11]MCG9696359.1 ATP-binding cassette domain-containing protein [Shewanella sp. Isolate11]